MNHPKKIILCLLFALAWSPAFSADNAIEASLPTITVNGVMAMNGTRQVIFKAAGVNSEAAGFVLGEGESQNKIKVVAIDEQSGVVTFDNHGAIQKILIEKAAPLNAYVPPPPAPVSAAVRPVSIPATSERPPKQGSGMNVVVIGSQRNNPLAGSRHINGIMPQSIDDGPHNFVSSSSQVPKNTSPANQPVQSTPLPSVPPTPSVPAPLPVRWSLPAMPAQPTQLPTIQPQPNGPQQMSGGADMEAGGSQQMLVPTRAPNGAVGQVESPSASHR